MTAPLLRRLNELQATTIMLSGNPQDSGKIRGHRFSRLPAGRGDAARRRRRRRRIVQLVNPFADEAAAARPSGNTRKGVQLMTLRVVPEGLAAASCRGRGADRPAGRRARRGRTRWSPRCCRPPPTRCRCRPPPASARTAPSTAPWPPRASRNSAASGVGVGESGTSYATGDAMAASSYLIAGS